jgi:hypothetical protein
MENPKTKKEPREVKNVEMLINLPVGEMMLKNDGDLGIILYKTYSKQEQVRTALQKLKYLDNSRFWIPDIEGEMEGSRLYLSYPRIHAHLKPFIDIVKNWQENPQLSISLFIDLTEFLVKCSQELNQTGVFTLPFSPLLIFNVIGNPNTWRVVVLPFFDNKIVDWAQADPLSWQWVSWETVLEGKLVDEDFLCGAVLHYCLAGDLFPELLTRQEKFKRLLEGRVGRFNALNQAFAAALPTTLAEEGEIFCKLIKNCLKPESSTPLNKELHQKYLEKIEKDFSPIRLATRWEYEGKPNIALDLLLTYADFARPDRVPWYVIARLKEKKGDWEGGLDARLKALIFGQDEAVHEAIHYLRRRANVKLGTEKYTFFREAFYTLEASFPRAIDDFHVLQMAHLEARYLQNKIGALKRLKNDFSDSWNQLLRIMFMARILCLQEEYPSVSRLCKKGIQIVNELLVNELPQQGFNEGRYVLSYLQILDGIAHFGAVGRLSDESFLIDAFAHFTGAMDVALEIEADDLIKIASHWLIFLEKCADNFPPKICQTLKTGINVYFMIKKITFGIIMDNFKELPSIPWYDEYLLFPD